MLESVPYENGGKYLWAALAILALAAVGIIDYFLSPHGISVSLFYFFPIALVAWSDGVIGGVAMAVASASIWLAVDAFSAPPSSQMAILLWNATVRLFFFMLAVFAIRLAKAREYHRTIARIDYLTGAFNSRFFAEHAQREIDRSDRYGHPFAIAYVDLDNFKSLNDTRGHRAGNECLQLIVVTANRHLRRADILARIGGDEFAILLPETGGEAAKIVLAKVRQSLLETMRQSDWPVTFSIGVMTFLKPPASVEDMLQLVDSVMYSVKKSGKNGISYAEFAG
jgi:diguanylate cyclase (GGDEF)-like protein